ncbi:MAG: thioredoxin domain-containing protein [Bacteroidota bacterium]|nr:thioredoxin domain-containing protein [Bacteroidota bacterium]
MRHLSVAFLFSFISLTAISAQGIEFFHGTWEDAILKAKQEDKIIFVDAFTTWCGPCKNMAANTFTAPEVGEYFNANFINMKIDMEKEMGLEFRKKFPVNAYPTLFFIDAGQEVVQKSVGAKNPTDFLTLGQTVNGKYDKSKKFETAYVAGDRSYKLVYDYVAALNKAGKPSTKIANDYLAEQKDLTTEDNLKFILEAASQVDCQCFDVLEKHKAAIIKITSETAFTDKVRQAANNTFKRAIEFESPELITLVADAMKRHLPAEADMFRSRSEIQYALAIHDLKGIDALIYAHIKKYVKNDPEGLYLIALDLNKYAADNKVCQDLALSLASRAAKDEDPKYVSTYAQLMHKSGAKQEAINILDEAIRKYKDEESKDLQSLKALKTKIENS